MRRKIFIGIVVLLLIIISVYALISFYPRLTIDYFGLNIITDRIECEYGQTLNISLVIQNNGKLPSKIHFKGYGGDQYELWIEDESKDEVYTPTTNALSRDIVSSLSLNSNEKRIFNYKWDLTRYSAGGCCGPTFGDFVEPGNYQIVFQLNLDPEFYKGKDIIYRKDIRVIPNNYSIPNYSISYKNITFNSDTLSCKYDETNGSLKIEYESLKSAIPISTINDTLRIRYYENNIIHISLKKTNDWFQINKTDYYLLEITISGIPKSSLVFFFDPIEFHGWDRNPVKLSL